MHRKKIGTGALNPDRDDVASFVCTELFKVVVKYLNESRKGIQRVFFEELGYFFVPWTSLEKNCSIKRADLTLRWHEAYAESKKKNIFRDN